MAQELAPWVPDSLPHHGHPDPQTVPNFLPLIGISCRFSAQISHVRRLRPNRDINRAMALTHCGNAIYDLKSGTDRTENPNGTGLVIRRSPIRTKFFSIERPHRHENQSSRRRLSGHLRPPAGAHPGKSRGTRRPRSGWRGSRFSSFAHLSGPPESRSVHDDIRPQADSARNVGRLCE